jgi:hypothetical protein
MIIAQKVERAWAAVIPVVPEVAAYFEANGAVQIVKGRDPQEQERPCIVVEVTNTVEEPQGTGNFWVDVRVRVLAEADQQEPFDDPAGAHEGLCQAVIGGLSRDDLHTLLSEAEADFYVWDGIIDNGADPSVKGRSYEEGHLWRIYCCARDMVD